MNHVAGLAAIHLDRRMLVNERTLLVGMALEADRSCVAAIRTCLGPSVPCGLWQSVHWIKPFVHAVVEGHFKLGLLARWHP